MTTTKKIYRKENPRPRGKRYGKLVWYVNSSAIVLLENMEWHALQKERMRLKGEAQYQRGKLKLHYQHTKV